MSGEAAQSEAGTFSKVERNSTLAEKVAADITQAILDGSLAPGERLVSERDLALQFGVSRTVIREAVRSLVPSGLIESRSGRGLQVAEVGSDAVSRSMDVFLRRSHEIDYQRVFEVRSALEIDMAGLAAERATPDDLKELRSLTAQLKDSGESDLMHLAQLDVAFHRAVAEATQNELFNVLLGAIGSVLLEVRLRAFSAPGLREEAVAAHEEILEQIEAGAPDRARDAMRRHLQSGAASWADGPPEPQS